jgi:hypothetical protein
MKQFTKLRCERGRINLRTPPCRRKLRVKTFHDRAGFEKIIIVLRTDFKLQNLFHDVRGGGTHLFPGKIYFYVLKEPVSQDFQILYFSPLRLLTYTLKIRESA